MAVDAGQLFGRGISFPPRVGPDGRVAVSEGPDNVREAIRVILTTERRERVMLADFGGGLNGFLFEPNTVTTRQAIADRVRRALTQWEPRVVVESVDVAADPDDPQGAVATITYRLVATGARERVDVNVALGS
jgi:phage baseplate assembly protein W